MQLCIHSEGGEKVLNCFTPSDNQSTSDGRTNQNPGEKIISDLKVVNGTDSQSSSTGFQEKYYTRRVMITA